MSLEESQVPPARGKENGCLGTENIFHKFLRNAGFYLATRNSSVVQLELISVYMEGLRPNSIIRNWGLSHVTREVGAPLRVLSSVNKRV